MGKDDIILPGPEDEVREEEGQQERPAADAAGTTVVSGQGDDTIGQYGRGNIDLYNRPQYKNEDGRISTVRSMSANIDGKEVLLPTVSRDQNGNPILLSNDEAIQRYRDTGEYLGIFDTVDEANSYAENLHKQQEKYYAATNTITGQDDSVNQREIAEGPEGGTTPNKGQQQQVTTPSTHLYDWGGEGVTFEGVMKEQGKDKPLSQIIRDYLSWCNENGVTPNIWEINDAIHDKDTSKSYEQNELDEQKRLNKEKWDKVGNFLTHLGNAVGTLAGGGHAPLKLEDPVQWTERQRKLRDATLAQRNAYNHSYLEMMYKQSADQRAADMAKQQMEMKKVEQEQKAKLSALEEERIRAVINGENKKADKIQAEIDRIKELLPYEVDVKKSQASKNRTVNKSGKTGGYGRGDVVTIEENEYNDDGKVVKKKITKSSSNAGGSGGTSKEIRKPRTQL